MLFSNILFDEYGTYLKKKTLNGQYLENSNIPGSDMSKINGNDLVYHLFQFAYRSARSYFVYFIVCRLYIYMPLKHGKKNKSRNSVLLL